MGCTALHRPLPPYEAPFTYPLPVYGETASILRLERDVRQTAGLPQGAEAPEEAVSPARRTPVSLPGLGARRHLHSLDMGRHDIKQGYMESLRPPYIRGPPVYYP